MNERGERFGDRGKAMIGLVVVPLLIPAVAGSFHAIRLLAKTEQANPSIVGYYDLVEEADRVLTALEATVQEEASEADWLAAIEKRQRLREEDEALQQRSRQAVRERPKAVMLGDLELQGIFWKEGQPIVYVNHELVELNETVNGWTITHIGKDKMVATGPDGSRKTYDLDVLLGQLYPGYRRP